MASTIRVWNGNQYQDHILEQFGKSRLFIGSGSYCDIVIKGFGIAEQQGIFLNNNGTWFYQDAGSMSGTFFNGSRVTTHQLVAGNILVFGEVQGERTICFEVRSLSNAGTGQDMTDSQSVFAKPAPNMVRQEMQSTFSAGSAREQNDQQPSYGQGYTAAGIRTESAE